jgi:hypothetical protein
MRPSVGVHPRVATAATGHRIGARMNKESLRPLSDEPPQNERTDRLLRNLHDEDGGVGQRYRAISTLRDVWAGLDAADCLTRYERTGHAYIRVRPLF